MANTRIKDIDFSFDNTVTVCINISELQKHGCLEEYEKLRGVSFEETEYDYIYLEQAKVLGLIK